MVSAGIIKESDKGSRFLRLFHQPETEFFIFEKNEKPTQQG